MLANIIRHKRVLLKVLYCKSDGIGEWWFDMIWWLKLPYFHVELVLLILLDQFKSSWKNILESKFPIYGSAWKLWSQWASIKLMIECRRDRILIFKKIRTRCLMTAPWRYLEEAYSSRVSFLQPCSLCQKKVFTYWLSQCLYYRDCQRRHTSNRTEEM